MRSKYIELDKMDFRKVILCKTSNVFTSTLKLDLTQLYLGYDVELKEWLGMTSFNYENMITGNCYNRPIWGLVPFLNGVDDFKFPYHYHDEKLGSTHIFSYTKETWNTLKEYENVIVSMNNLLNITLNMNLIKPELLDEWAIRCKPNGDNWKED